MYPALSVSQHRIETQVGAFGDDRHHGVLDRCSSNMETILSLLPPPSTELCQREGHQDILLAPMFGVTVWGRGCAG